jgi:ketosteroid isomerase-like protein
MEGVTVTLEEARQFAEQWAAAWNRHDLDAVLSHYTDDFEMTTPMIQRVLGLESGTLKGKAAVGDYWRAALKKVPDLKFTILEVTCGVSAVSVYYQAVLGKKAVETFFFDETGKVYRALATYN